MSAEGVVRFQSDADAGWWSWYSYGSCAYLLRDQRRHWMKRQERRKALAFLEDI